MQNYIVRLESPPSDSFRCTKAANSLDIDLAKKLKHELSVNCDLKTEYNVGLILGASGSGKTTLAKKMFGEDCFQTLLDPKKTILDQMPEHLSYDECSAALLSVGLSSVPCWIRPAYTLSNGQKARAEAALHILSSNEHDVIDEWTSVVDRTVAKAMSFCLQKAVRRQKKSIVLCSCHYDVVEWLNPDWVIDCNKQTYEDRRSMVGTFERTDRLRLDIRESSKRAWKYFSKYHYLSDRLPGGTNYLFGLFYNNEQIGFQCFSFYIPGNRKIVHSNRTVIHPDYVGLGLGIKLINETSHIMAEKGFDVRAKFTSIPVYKAMIKQAQWAFLGEDVAFKAEVGAKLKNDGRNKTLRKKVRTFKFKFRPKKKGGCPPPVL